MIDYEPYGLTPERAAELQQLTRDERSYVIALNKRIDTIENISLAINGGGLAHISGIGNIRLEEYNDIAMEYDILLEQCEDDGEYPDPDSIIISAIEAYIDKIDKEGWCE